jgi:hypothetical protein
MNTGTIQMSCLGKTAAKGSSSGFNSQGLTTVTNSFDELGNLITR